MAKKFTRSEVMTALGAHLYATKGAYLTWSDVDRVLAAMEKKDG